MFNSKSYVELFHLRQSHIPYIFTDLLGIMSFTEFRVGIYLEGNSWKLRVELCKTALKKLHLSWISYSHKWINEIKQ
jgi:hypothetical protein